MNAGRLFALGDKVTIKAHTWFARLYPDIPIHDERSEGWVVARIGEPLLLPRYGEVQAVLERIDKHGYLERRFKSLDVLELVKRGKGTMVPGIDRPLSGSEKIDLQEIDWLIKIHRVLREIMPYQGYANAATFSAAVSLANDANFVNQLAPTMRRQDGTINPDKVEKAFFERGHRVDDWATQLPLEVPRLVMARPSVRRIIRSLEVNWAEVAADFAAEKPPKGGAKT